MSAQSAGKQNFICRQVQRSIATRIVLSVGLAEQNRTQFYCNQGPVSTKYNEVLVESSEELLRFSSLDRYGNQVSVVSESKFLWKRKQF